MANADHPRLVLHNFLSPHLCKELEFIHKSSSTVGYRPNVFSTTLSHLIATKSPHLIMHFIPIRERLKEKVEEFFGCPYELFVEFTGLISWSKGASIGWHSDDNRPYLKQRDFAAVCYLNTYGVDFRGGLFHFQDGEPATFKPMTGDVLLYTADTRNIHSVDEILDGERLTLTLWFTRDKSHDEDSKLISFINRSPLNISSEFDTYPLPASDDMYWFSLDQNSNHLSGFDLRCARIHILGYDLYSSKLRNFPSAVDFSEVLIEPLQLSRGNVLFEKEFANVMHLLQVVYFYHWRVTELQTSEIKRKTNNTVSLSQSELEKIGCLKLFLMKDVELVETVFGSPECKNDPFDWDIFSAAVALWKSYTRKLIKEMHMHLPYWTSHQSLFINPSLDLDEGT